MTSWFGRLFGFEEDAVAAIAQRGHNKFDRVHSYLKVEATGSGGCVLTVKSSGKLFWVGRYVGALALQTRA